MIIPEIRKHDILQNLFELSIEDFTDPTPINDKWEEDTDERYMYDLFDIRGVAFGFNKSTCYDQTYLILPKIYKTCWQFQNLKKVVKIECNLDHMVSYGLLRKHTNFQYSLTDLSLNILWLRYCKRYKLSMFEYPYDLLDQLTFGEYRDNLALINCLAYCFDHEHHCHNMGIIIPEEIFCEYDVQYLLDINYLMKYRNMDNQFQLTYWGLKELHKLYPKKY
jgi:hypothetical protein